jgi:hypothetical protein
MPNQAQLGVETLKRDAAALFSFVDSICQFCVDHDSPAYLEPSQKFFEYIRDLGDATKAYLNTFSEKAPKDPRLYQDYRQKLETIRSGWFEFHQFIKPAIDADTLSMPYPLVEALTRRLNQIKQLEKAKFILFHLDEVNYLQVRVSGLTRTADRLASIIPDARVFPPELGDDRDPVLSVVCLVPKLLDRPRNWTFRVPTARADDEASAESESELRLPKRGGRDDGRTA